MPFAQWAINKFLLKNKIIQAFNSMGINNGTKYTLIKCVIKKEKSY